MKPYRFWTRPEHNCFHFSQTLVTTHLYEGSMETKDEKQFTDRQVIYQLRNTDSFLSSFHSILDTVCTVYDAISILWSIDRGIS